MESRLFEMKYIVLWNRRNLLYPGSGGCYFVVLPLLLRIPNRWKDPRVSLTRPPSVWDFFAISSCRFFGVVKMFLRQIPVFAPSGRVHGTLKSVQGVGGRRLQ